MFIAFHASLFLTLVSFINLTNWDLVQSVNEKQLSNFMIFANDSNLKTVNYGHFQALVRKVTEYLMNIIKGWLDESCEATCI